ncbi:hypothetical protein QAD02_008381 [Eretmocerus hayati]|uniref:Uncharacterized protein n=1 Tax=Eretmocerus hayati TaxID=131215 RepID=A0ACC2N6P0_9HYME|nr:hypothetical protein QAD02_008381 [Eretmocerus hayati]
MDGTDAEFRESFAPGVTVADGRCEVVLANWDRVKLPGPSSGDSTGAGDETSIESKIDGTGAGFDFLIDPSRFRVFFLTLGKMETTGVSSAVHLDRTIHEKEILKVGIFYHKPGSVFDKEVNVDQGERKYVRTSGTFEPLPAQCVQEGYACPNLSDHQNTSHIYYSFRA